MAESAEELEVELELLQFEQLKLFLQPELSLQALEFLLFLEVQEFLVFS